MQSTTIGVDLSKSVFQLSLADERHHITKRQRLSRSQFNRFISHTPPSRLIMEGCAGAHHWGRLAQSNGHQVKLLHAHYVRPYVRRDKTDAADADALLRADQDHELKPIPVKSEQQQALQSLHRIRAQWRSALTARINEARGLLGEFGIVLPRGTRSIGYRLHAVMHQLPDLLQPAFSELISEIGQLGERLGRVDKTLNDYAHHDPVGQRLMRIPGIGPTIATAMLGRVPDMHVFRRGRSFASWLGVTPREYSSGSNRYLGRISRRGDSYLRMLLIHGARAALLAAKRQHKAGRELTRLQQWALDTQQRVGHNKATVALANKLARIAWAVWTKGIEFDGNDARRFD